MRRNWWHLSNGGPIPRNVVHEAGASGIDVLIVGRQETPPTKALDSRLAEE